MRVNYPRKCGSVSRPVPDLCFVCKSPLSIDSANTLRVPLFPLPSVGSMILGVLFLPETEVLIIA